MRRALVPSVVSGFVLGASAAIVAALVVSHVVQGGNQTDATVLSAYAAWALFFFVGVGALNYPARAMVGRTDPTEEEEAALAGHGQGGWRYFRFCTDHKVVGMQYLATVLVLFLVGGLGAFMIRLQQSTPNATFFTPATYNTLVGIHGLVMIAAVIVMITGSFGNFILPIMIGARDMAFPRLNALSYWLLFAAIPVFLTTIPLGGFPTGWTGYAPLADQAGPGMDAYCATIILFGASITFGAVNTITTVLTMRTKGMGFGRLPIFVWGVSLSVLLGLIAFPTFVLSQVMVVMDRAMGTSFFITAQGGSNWLFEHLFWFMGHPEVYVIALPAMGIAAEVTAVFTRKTLYGYKLLVAGMVGIVALSVLVWAHHLYLSGSNTALNGPFMLSTELISIPTGLVFLVLVGTFWRGRIWLTVPLLFVVGFLINFVIGGVTGLYLADVPTDAILHGGMFITAHFHFTLVGGMVFGFFAGFYYWFPKMTGRRLNERLGQFHFALFEIGFLGAMLSLFYAGLKGEPRWQAEVPIPFATANTVASIFTILLVAAMFVFIYNVVLSLVRGERAAADEWGAKTLEWTVPTPVPLENFDQLPVVTSGPYDYGEPAPAPHMTGMTPSPSPAE